MTTHSQFVTSGRQFPQSSTSSHDWKTIDDEFCSMVAPIHTTLASDELGVEEAADIFSDLLSSHLQHHEVICPPPSPNQPQEQPNNGPHCPKAIAHRKVSKGKEHPVHTIQSQPERVYRRSSPAQQGKEGC